MTNTNPTNPANPARRAKTAVRRLACVLLALSMVAGLSAQLKPGCTPEAKKRLASVNSIATPTTVEMFAGETPSAIAGAQACLKQQGCYDGNKAEVDGIVGPFTRAALYRLAYGECTPAPSPPACGSGDDIVAWRLTPDNIKELEKDHVPAADQDSSTNSGANTGSTLSLSPGTTSSAAVSQSASGQAIPVPPASAVPLGTSSASAGSVLQAVPQKASSPASAEEDALWQGELKDGLAFMQDLEYPTKELFANALEFFTDQFVVGEPRAHRTVLNGVKREEAEIVGKACKSFPIDQQVPAWKADWKANMVYPLSDRVYALYPSGLLAPLRPGTVTKDAPVPYKVDFGVLSGIGWAGATFSQSLGINLEPTLRDVTGGIEEQIKIARQFRTNVDLVVYKSQSAGEWYELTSQDSNLRTLASQISAEVTREQPGFLNSVQYWALPDALTMAATAWDGVTLDFRDYPFNDPEAVKSLASLLTYIRADLTQASAAGRKSVWRGKPQNFDVNLVVPFAIFMADGAPMLSVLKDECDLSGIVSLNSQNRIMQLAALVPEDRAAGRVEQNSTQSGEVVDNFIVSLPQPTGCAKKALRLAIESAFERTPRNLKILKDEPEVSLAAWRYQMLRRVVFELSPETWKYTGPDYQLPGSQFYDDLMYAKDNFGGVAFSSLPAYQAEAAADSKGAKPAAPLGAGQSSETPLALDIHRVFAAPGTPDFAGRASPGAAVGKQWPATVYLANFCGAYRRQIFLTSELLLGLLLLYAVLSYWIFDLRTFYEEHRLWFWGTFLLAMVLIVLLCLYDRRLRDVAAYIYVGLSFFVVFAAWAWQYIRSSIQRDLP